MIEVTFTSRESGHRILQDSIDSLDMFTAMVEADYDVDQLVFSESEFSIDDEQWMYINYDQGRSPYKAQWLTHAGNILDGLSTFETLEEATIFALGRVDIANRLGHRAYQIVDHSGKVKFYRKLR